MPKILNKKKDNKKVRKNLVPSMYTMVYQIKNDMQFGIQ